MAIGKMSTVHNTDRYFSIAVDEYSGRSIKGVLYQENLKKGIYYDSLLEMIINMDSILDAVGCPKQAFQMRCFPGTKAPVVVSRNCEETKRDGKLATLCIYIKYRYNAGWQGTISWKEGKRTEKFESDLQMILLMDQILNGKSQEKLEGKSLNYCHVAIDDYDFGRIVGNYQNIPMEKAEHFYGLVDLAKTLVDFLETGNSEEEILKKRINYGKLITSEACSICRKGGQKATFSVKIMFREHSTWQGVIYWREGRVQQQFRSLKEMLFMIAAAIKSTAVNKGYGEMVHLAAAGS